MKTIETKVFEFDELNDKAKEKARDWYRRGAFDHEWWDFVYEDATTMGKLMGLDIKKIFFTGFSSQGDGACFEGSWNPCEVKAKELRAEAPNDKVLHKIASEFERLALHGVSFTVKQRGHYMHKYCTEFYFSAPDDISDTPLSDVERIEKVEEALKETAREFMEWIYRRLEREWDYMNEDAQVDDNILANGYTFTADGKRFG